MQAMEVTFDWDVLSPAHTPWQQAKEKKTYNAIFCVSIVPNGCQFIGIKSIILHLLLLLLLPLIQIGSPTLLFRNLSATG